MKNLFDAAGVSRDKVPRPLADRLRPSDVSEIIGQDHLLDKEAPIGRMVAAGRFASMILWGPPGSGKTSIARLLADKSGFHFEQISAVFSGVSELRRVFDSANVRRADGIATLLFVDEVHRFNRAQQDSFLPVVEDGTIILIGATTENPSFELNAALVSRCQVLVLRRLGVDSLEQLLVRAESSERRRLPLDQSGRSALCDIADGDGRYILNLAEELFALSEDQPLLDRVGLIETISQRAPLYDKAQEGHYSLISALHKSLRGSDVDAGLYWLARMLVAGEEPLYIARRLVRFSVEDIGLADPLALSQAIAARDAYIFLGSPEGELALAQLVVYLATAPKSNSGYRALISALDSARENGSLMPPKHILNAPTSLLNDLGYGHGYQYDHDTPDRFSGQNYFPDEMQRKRFFFPTTQGYERKVAERLEKWRTLREKKEGASE